MSRKDWTDDKLIFRLMNNRSDKTYWDNMDVLRRRPSKELFSKCEELIKSSKPKNKIIGIDILAQLGGSSRPFLKKTLQLYFDLLKTETDPKVLHSLLSAIGHNNDKLTKLQIEILCSFSDNPNQLVKDGLVFSLLGIESPKAIETLIKLSTDKSNDVRNWATFGIGSSIDSDNENIREALLKRTNDKHGETRHEAIIGLAMRGDSRVVEIIKQELIGGEFGYLLFAAILETKDKEFLPLLQQNLRAVEGDTSINPEWIRDLKKCIDELTKLTNET